MSLREQLRFESLEQRRPQVALARSVPPICTDRATGALPFAQQKEAASAAAADGLRRVIQREVALEAFAVGFDEVDPVLVGPPAIAALAMALHPLDGARGVRIAAIPDTGRGLILAEEHMTDVGEHVEAQVGKLRFERRAVEKRRQ